jgi:hypothetical protein
MSHYQFIVDGTPTELVRQAFPELKVTDAPVHGGTSLHGDLPDNAAVRSVLNKLDDLGLSLVEMRQIPA